MAQKREIYGSYNSKRLEKELPKWDSLEGFERSKELIHKFKDGMLARGVGQARVAKVLSELRKILPMLRVEFDQAEVFNIDSVLATIQQITYLAPATKSDYRRALKQFYKWFEDHDPRLYDEDSVISRRTNQFYRYLREKVSGKYKMKRIDPNSIILPKDINKVIKKGCRTAKEKALVRFLHETGCRIGELLAMQIKDIQFGEVSAKVVLDGKTGLRQIPIVLSIELLQRWIEEHPYSDDPNAFFWVSHNPRCLYKPLKSQGVCKLLNRCFDRAGVTKKHNPHWFRHSRASLLAQKLPEAMLCKYMGWVLGSKQVVTYVHLSNSQLEEEYLFTNGVKVPEKRILELQECNFCKKKCDGAAMFCVSCGRPLSLEVALNSQEQYQQELEKTSKFMLEMLKSEELRNRFQEFLAQNV